jgi:putative tricarboxylic transport membrane protein
MRSDRWLGPLVSALALVWLLLAYLYIPGAREPGEPGPRGFPVVLGGAMLLLGLLMTFSGFARRRGPAPAEASAAPSRHELRIVLGTFGLLMLYAFLMQRAGFLVATPIVLVLTMAGLLRMRRWGFIVMMAGGTTLVCWLVFAVLLRVPLPRGSWWWLL